MEEVWKRWNSYIKKESEEFTLFSGIMETLAALQQRGIQTGVVTSRTKEEVNNVFTPHGLIKYMKYLVSSDDTEKFKPNPDPILKYLELSSINPSNLIYVGDTLYDKYCAQSAGVKFALALWGAKNPDKIGGDYILESPCDILKLIE